MATRDIVKLTGINAVNFDPTYPVLIKHAHAHLVSSSGVGNRQVEVQAETVAADATSIYLRYAAGATQAASLTRDYSFGYALQVQATFTDGTIEHPMAEIYVPAGGRFSVFDAANIDNTNDALTVFLQIERL